MKLGHGQPFDDTLWWLWYAWRDDIAEGMYPEEDATSALQFVFEVFDKVAELKRALTRDEFLALRHAHATETEGMNK